MEQNANTKLAEAFLDFGEAMLNAGGEIGRVEDSLDRLSRAYGALHTDVFAITSSIVLTLKFQNGDAVTVSRRIRKGSDFDFEKIDRLNALARSCVNSPPDCEALRERIGSIAGTAPKPWKLYAGSVLAAGGFCVFFGGTLADALISSLFALLIAFLQLRFSHVCPTKTFFLFIVSFFCGMGICSLGRLLPVIHTDMVIIGDIMLLVPGIAITTAARDMVIGDTISGATRLVECLLWATMLAGGFMLAMILVGR